MTGAAPAGALTAPTPANTSAPTLTGTPVPGQTLTCAPGTWSGNPSGFSYAWLRDGAPIAGQTGSTYIVQSADQGHSISCTVTAANVGGEYTISGLSSGSYKVSFEAFEGNYLSQYYNGMPSQAAATSVSVSAPGMVSAINAELQAGGRITGRVTSASGGAPIAGVEVCAFTGAPNFFSGCASTSSSGEYTISGLATASYTVEFMPPSCFEEGCVVPNYVGQERAEVAVSAPGTVSAINAELQEGGRITGTVTNASSTSLSGVEACASGSRFESCAFTNGAGEYTISGLATGSYTVSFYAPETYAPRFYDEKEAFREADAVLVTAGSTTPNIDAKMQEGGQITGTVADAGATPLANVLVCAIELSGGFFGGCAITNGAGKYAISGLASGKYTVSFEPFEGNYTTRYYNEKESFGEAETVPVSVGFTTPNIDAKMQEGGQITGTVTDASTHAAIAKVRVCASEVGGELSGCASTDSAGQYAIPGLASAKYTVSFRAREGNYQPQYFNGQPTSVTAGEVSVSAGSIAPDINAALIAGGQITGRVTDPSTHAGIANVEVCAFAEEEGFGCALTRGAGRSASATSGAVAVPAPNSRFTLLGKARFNAKTGNLTFTFNLPNPGKLSWSLFFRNSDVGFADSLAISAGPEGDATAASKKGKGKPKKCAAGSIKHKGKCVHSKVPFGSGSRNVAGAGTVQVSVHASAKAIAALKAGHTLHVSGTFTFQSALGGTPFLATESAVVHPPKHRSKRHGKHGH